MLVYTLAHMVVNSFCPTMIITSDVSMLHISKFSGWMHYHFRLGKIEIFSIQNSKHYMTLFGNLFF